jgi:hypothetical protein
MDQYERMIIRAAAEWREKLRSGDVKTIIDPTNGEVISRPEVHHISREKYGELSIPLSVSTHREMTRRQMEEHPPDGANPDNPVERAARFLLGAADLLECIVDELRRVAEFLISLAASGIRGV